MEDLKIDPKAIVVSENVIGHGSSGRLLTGKWKEKDVTVKTAIKFKKDDPEIKKLNKLKHPNVVQLFGVVEDKPSYYIILEYVENGSLFDFLYKDKKRPNPEQTLQWPKEIARGLEYLHHLKIIHRDLKSSSVLLTADYSVKLSGFGSPRLFEPDLLPQRSSSFRWMAPEGRLCTGDCQSSLTLALTKIAPKQASDVHSEPSVSFFCDVFSFGMVLWEILECKLPFEEIALDSTIKAEIVDGKTPVIPDSCEDHIKELLKLCWKKDPKERPTSFRILSILEKGSIAANDSSAGDSTPIVSEGIYIDEDDIEEGERLSKDYAVYVGNWKSQKMKVAVKSSSLNLQEKQTKQEVAVLKQLQHRNIIKFYGIVDKRPTVLIITELAENGSLYDFLHVDKLYPNYEQIRCWPQEVADGMNCLHKLNYAHRDLSSKSIVLSKNWTVKLTGFKSAKETDHSTMQTLVGASRWTAPEVLEEKRVNSKLSDVWSYGMVVFEIYTCKLPYADINEAFLKQQIMKGAERPTFQEILSTLEEISAGSSQATTPVDETDGSLKESDVERIADKLRDVAVMWYPLGNVLKLGKEDLITTDNDPFPSLKNILTNWIRKGGSTATVEALAECVSNMFGRDDLAKALREEFGK